jgi:hypothetical protein
MKKGPARMGTRWADGSPEVAAAPILTQFRER